MVNLTPSHINKPSLLLKDLLYLASRRYRPNKNGSSFKNKTLLRIQQLNWSFRVLNTLPIVVKNKKNYEKAISNIKQLKMVHQPIWDEK